MDNEALERVKEFCPAKLNLFLAVTNRRDDGFHELVSVVSQIDVGDTLVAQISVDSEFELSCDDVSVPIDQLNLVIQAAEQFRVRSGWNQGVKFELRKVTPMGAGLGGGSSDAAGALRAMNRLAGAPLPQRELADISVDIGSDCPLFFAESPVVIRGRGEHIEPLPPSTCARLVGRDVLVVKPPFGINTGWAYGRLAEPAPQDYMPKSDAEQHLRDWIEDSNAAPEALGFNSFERPIGAKFSALPAMAENLREKFGRTLHLSGSGSACYIWPRAESESAAIAEAIRADWGSNVWIISAKIVGDLA